MVVTRRMLSVTAAVSPGSRIADVKVEETVVGESSKAPRKRRKLVTAAPISIKSEKDVPKELGAGDPKAGEATATFVVTPKGKKTKSKLLETLHTEDTLPLLQEKAGKVRIYRAVNSILFINARHS